MGGNPGTLGTTRRNTYGVARIHGALEEEVEPEMETAMDEKTNEQPEVTTVVDVGTFVETLLARQDAFEKEIRTEVKKIDELFAAQAKTLRDAVDSMVGLTAMKRTGRAGKSVN